MKKRFLEQIFAVVVAVAILFSSNASQALAVEIYANFGEENQIEMPVEDRKGEMEKENEEPVLLEQEEEKLEPIVQGDISEENIEEEIKEGDLESISLQEKEVENTNKVEEENIESVSSEQMGGSLEQTVQEDITQENTTQIENQEGATEIEENGLEIGQDEIGVQKTRVIRTSSYEQYYEENIKLVEQYPSLNSESPYALRRILGKMNQEIDFENYRATVVIIGPDNSFILQFETEEMTEQAFLMLSQLEQLAYCELDTMMPEVEPMEENDQIAIDNKDWDIKMLEIDQYIKYVKEKVGNKSITVCILDTGTDATHPKLKNRIKEGVKGAAYTDTDGHGTHVAGIVAKCTEGLNVKILPIEGIGEWSLAANGTKLAVSKGAKVINMSFGTTYYGDLIRYNCYKAFHDAIEMALNAGVSIVTAAGNNGYTDLTIEDYYECPPHFGIKDGVITVASVDKNQKRADDSGYGSAVDLAAPGVDIYSTYLGHTYVYMSGTSMAAPHITAIVAMMRLVNPEKSPAEIENLLKSYCKDRGSKGRDNYYGQGIPQMSRAFADIDKLNEKHVWNEQYTVDKAPTCTENGTESIHCADCGMIKPESTKSIKALGHNKVTTIVKASLTKSGSSTVKCTRCSYSSKKTIYYPKTIKLERTKYQYTGNPKRPAVKVIDSKGNDIDSSNYTVQYEGKRIQIGTYTVKIQFKGKYYKGTAERTFTIQDMRPYQKIDAKNCEKVYGDKAFKLKASLTSGDGSLSFKSSNTNVATINSTGKVTIKNIGKTTITITASETAKYKKTTKKIVLTVIPKQLAITRLKNSVAKTMEVGWSKDSSVDGYALQYATNINFTNASTVYIKTNRTNTRKITKLTKGKRYYVRVRSYKVVDEKNYYSKWSSIRYILLRK